MSRYFGLPAMIMTTTKPTDVISYTVTVSCSAYGVNFLLPEQHYIANLRPLAGTELIKTLDRLPGSKLGLDWLQNVAPEPDESLGRWFARLIEQCCPGIIVVEAKDLRPLWQQSLQQVINRWPSDALAERATAIQQAGYDLAFDDLTEPPVFVDQADGRGHGAWNQHNQRNVFKLSHLSLTKHFLLVPLYDRSCNKLFYQSLAGSPVPVNALSRTTQPHLPSSTHYHAALHPSSQRCHLASMVATRGERLGHDF